MSLSVASMLGNQASSPLQKNAQQTLENQLGNADAKAVTATAHDKSAKESDVHAAFQEFVGKTFYGQMLKSMRKTVGKSAYFNGGRGEEVFQQQLDQLVVERVSQKSAGPLADSMYDLTALSRRR